MRGWVYVATMTNTVGVVKIGYSERDPDLRVKEWARDTGAVGEAKVEYAVWVSEPRDYETRIHQSLADKRQKGGEWFKCDVSAAIEAILKVGTPLIQNVRTGDEKFVISKAYRSEIDELREKLKGAELDSAIAISKLNEARTDLRNEKNAYSARWSEVRAQEREIFSLRTETRHLRTQNQEYAARIDTLQTLNMDLEKNIAELKAGAIAKNISADRQSEVSLVSCSVCSLKSIVVSCPSCQKKHRVPAFEKASGGLRCGQCSRTFDVIWIGEKVTTRLRREVD